MARKSLFTEKQKLELRLIREEEHLESWRRDTHKILIKCLAEVKLNPRQYMEIFYNVCNSALTGASRTADFRLNKLRNAPEKEKIKWAKNLTWKDIVEEMIFQFQDDIVDSITEMVGDSDEEEEEDEEYDCFDSSEEDVNKKAKERMYFLGLMRKLSLMYSIVLENKRREDVTFHIENN